jgi:hypothetical protein
MMTIKPGRLSVSWDPSADGVSLILSASGVHPDSLQKVFQVMADLFESGIVRESLIDRGQLGIDCESDQSDRGTRILNADFGESDPSSDADPSSPNSDRTRIDLGSNSDRTRIDLEPVG